MSYNPQDEPALNKAESMMQPQDNRNPRYPWLNNEEEKGQPQNEEEKSQSQDEEEEDLPQFNPADLYDGGLLLPPLKGIKRSVLNNSGPGPKLPNDSLNDTGF